MGGSERAESEDDVLHEQGETGSSARPGGEGGGGADADESFTIGGPRGLDAERGEYDNPSPDGA